MRPRTRSAALLALLALVLTWTGGAWAAMCAMEETGYGAVATAPAGHAHGHHDGHPAPSHDAGEGERAPACPLMALGGVGTCLGSFVGAESSFPATAFRSHAHSFAPPRDARDLLLADRPFHPPEA